MVEEYELWDHPIGEVYEEMEKLGLIPEYGDAKYVIPAAVLRANRLLYERLNNGMANYYMEEDGCGFYHEREEELNDLAMYLGMDDYLGSIIIEDDPDEVWKKLDEFLEIVKSRRDDWTAEEWNPCY